MLEIIVSCLGSLLIIIVGFAFIMLFIRLVDAIVDKVKLSSNVIITILSVVLWIVISLVCYMIIQLRGGLF